MPTFNDFFSSNYSSFEVKIYICKKEADLFINFPNINGKSEDNEKYLKNSLGFIDNEINWIENNKNKIEDVLLKNSIIELAENIVSSAYLLECVDEECYMLDDGFKIYLPISDNDFLDSLYIESVSIDFNENFSTSIELILLCKPDYFRGQYMVIVIDKDKNIEFKGLEED